jgi:hypothetical protein
MKIADFIIRILLIVLAALLFADALLTSINGTTIISYTAFKLIVGFILLVLVASHFAKTKT